MGSRIGYKLFRVKKSCPGKLFPLFVLSNKEMPMNEWLIAESGEMKEGKVKSKLGLLKFRPGFHINDKVPYVNHIGQKTNGVITHMHDDTVWCEVEYHTDIDYNAIARIKGKSVKGNYNMRDACLNYVPQRGFYYYKTSPQMFDRWIISGEMKINRIMSDEEVENLCLAAGLTPLKRKHDFDKCKYGFVG